VTPPPHVFVIYSCHLKHRVVPYDLTVVLISIEDLVLASEIIIGWILSAHNLPAPGLQRCAIGHEGISISLSGFQMAYKYFFCNFMGEPRTPEVCHGRGVGVLGELRAVLHAIVFLQNA
jgi:hypothetical protein